MSNKSAGTSFEKEFCKLASEHGFWAHMLQGNAQGQPSDVIIAKDGISVLLDCKVCDLNVFKFSRIEENQECSMRKWLKKGNKYALFALKVGSEVYIIPLMKLISLREAGIKQINFTKIKEIGVLFEDWVW
jgi:Holliday junction resolvase